ncbi:sensor histidine kinase [Flavobacterium amniphilum]|uniref:tetratricopeptide repeat-containing sensor histidine kinase n=1 Tax=Flavobacterium amniphilum TaxID=1834035 RepID=UPI002029E419|nr:sensor histidine kinase [Flavobacterium amniphilum]MCL9805914.1 sensor histidine kinase [Flavobacterium amniphilum]
MKKVFYSILLLFIFSSCHEEKSNTGSVSSEEIESLLIKANDFEVANKERVAISNHILQLLQNQPNDSLNRARYFKLAGRYFNAEDYVKYLYVCRELYKMSNQAGDTLYIARSLNYIGDYHYNRFKNDSAYYYYIKTEKAYSHLKGNPEVLRVKFWKANILLHEKDFTGAETAIVSILKEAKIGDDARLVYDCYITLGNALEGLNNLDESLIYYQKAYESSLELKKDPQHLLLKAQAYNFIGRLYLKKEEYENAIFYFKSALQFANFKNSDPVVYSNLINNWAYAKLELKDESSIGMFNEAVQIREKLNNIPGIVSSQINLSKYYLFKRDTIRALYYGLSAKKMANENKIFEDELSALKLLAKIEPHKNAKYVSRYIKLSDSLQDVERSTRNKFARIEFETDEILSQKNNIEAEKKKISIQLWVIVALSVGLLLLIIMAYITKAQHSKNKALQFEREQQKANEEIYRLMLNQQSVIDEARQNEKRRISQELHDGIMSKLTSTRLNLFILGKKNDEETIKKCLNYIAQIQDIEKEIRSISHDLGKENFLENDSFKAIVESLVESQRVFSDIDYVIEISSEIDWKDIESSIKINLYRIFQESLQNIYKYSKAKNVLIEIIKTDKGLSAIIKDDGRGFDTRKVREGIGLKNMQSRIKSLNGELKIMSGINKGTTIQILIPI